LVHTCLVKIKSARRLLKRIWLANRSSHNLDIFCTATNSYRRAIIRAKKVFNSSLISSSSSSSSSDPRKLWNSISKLRHRKPVPQLPSTIDFKSLSSVFASFFSDQVLKIHSALESRVTNTSAHTEPSRITTDLIFLNPATEDEICKLLS
jgi:hypothetical protein